jgi:hypothetical protein
MNSSKYDEAKVLQLITTPVEPLLPDSVERSNDTTIIKLKNIMHQTLQFNAAHRPTSTELTKRLKEIYESPQEQEEVQKSLSLKLSYFLQRGKTK